MDPVARPLHIFLAEKEGRISFNIICLKLYQFERTTWWCLSILEFVLAAGLQFVLLEKILKKSWPNANFGRPWNLIPSLPYRTPCRLFIHELFFGPLGHHLRVWSELGRSPPFHPTRALRLQWSWAFNLVCEGSRDRILDDWNVIPILHKQHSIKQPNTNYTVSEMEGMEACRTILLSSWNSLKHIWYQIKYIENGIKLDISHVITFDGSYFNIWNI